MLATGALTLIFTRSRETSDFWADALKMWWLSVKDQHSPIKRLVIYLDNGPKNSGTRTQWLRRLVEFCDWSGLEIRLVYYTVVDPVLPSLWYDGCCSLGPRSHGEHRPLFLEGGTDRL
jgi:Rhodopirellula transposase DDE domain